MIKFLISLLFRQASSPQAVQRLSETKPIRSAARFVAHIYFRVKGIAEQKGAPEGLERFKKTFSEEMKKIQEEQQRKR